MFQFKKYIYYIFFIYCNFTLIHNLLISHHSLYKLLFASDWLRKTLIYSILVHCQYYVLNKIRLYSPFKISCSEPKGIEFLSKTRIFSFLTQTYLRSTTLSSKDVRIKNQSLWQKLNSFYQFFLYFKFQIKWFSFLGIIMLSLPCPLPLIYIFR